MNETRGLWRGKRKENGEWVLGCLIRNSSKAIIFVLENNTNRMRGTDVDPSTLGECTGLHDKNGELIFEGDIISTGEDKYVVKFDSFIASFVKDAIGEFVKPMLLDEVNMSLRFEVIGNIHDNSELLELEVHNENT